MKHIIKTQDFSGEFLNDIFNLAKDMRNGVKNKLDLSYLKGKVIATLFYEASTRTRLSFESAIVRLGAYNLSTENASQFSSAAKGESLRDTIKIVNNYCDCIILRHKDKGSAQEATNYSKVPIINAGDGDGQHPTQSLLDLFTIIDNFKSLDGLEILLSGDLRYSRTIHSLVYLLAKYKQNNIKLHLASPNGLGLPDEILKYIFNKNLEFYQYNSINPVAYKVDVLYHTRPQKERYINNESLINYEDSKESFTITRELAEKMKKNAIILHPLPRTDEIRYGVDENHRAKYFEQAENGLYIRMAILKYLFYY